MVRTRRAAALRRHGADNIREVIVECESRLILVDYVWLVMQLATSHQLAIRIIEILARISTGGNL